MGAALRTEDHPLLVGARLANNQFKRTEPFGTIAVAVGDAGVPDDVQVVSLSKYAREQRLSESTVSSELEARGYRLLTPEPFFAFLDELKDKVLKGALSLPVKGRLTVKPAQLGSSPTAKPLDAIEYQD